MSVRLYLKKNSPYVRKNLFFFNLFYFYSCLKDPNVEIREKCGESSTCKHLKAQLEECNKRVSSTPGTHENCEEELFDFLRCVDDCVSLFVFYLLLACRIRVIYIEFIYFK